MHLVYVGFQCGSDNLAVHVNHVNQHRHRSVEKQPIAM